LFIYSEQKRQIDENWEAIEERLRYQVDGQKLYSIMKNYLEINVKLHKLINTASKDSSTMHRIVQKSRNSKAQITKAAASKKNKNNIGPEDFVDEKIILDNLIAIRKNGCLLVQPLNSPNTHANFILRIEEKQYKSTISSAATDHPSLLTISYLVFEDSKDPSKPKSVAFYRTEQSDILMNQSAVQQSRYSSTGSTYNLKKNVLLKKVMKVANGQAMKIKNYYFISPSMLVVLMEENLIKLVSVHRIHKEWVLLEPRETILVHKNVPQEYGLLTFSGGILMLSQKTTKLVVRIYYFDTENIANTPESSLAYTKIDVKNQEIDCESFFAGNNKTGTKAWDKIQFCEVVKTGINQVLCILDIYLLNLNKELESKKFIHLEVMKDSPNILGAHFNPAFQELSIISRFDESNDIKASEKTTGLIEGVLMTRFIITESLQVVPVENDLQFSKCYIPNNQRDLGAISKGLTFSLLYLDKKPHTLIILCPEANRCYTANFSSVFHDQRKLLRFGTDSGQRVPFENDKMLHESPTNEQVSKDPEQNQLYGSDILYCMSDSNDLSKLKLKAKLHALWSPKQNSEEQESSSVLFSISAQLGPQDPPKSLYFKVSAKAVPKLLQKNTPKQHRDAEAKKSSDGGAPSSAVISGSIEHIELPSCLKITDDSMKALLEKMSKAELYDFTVSRMFGYFNRQGVGRRKRSPGIAIPPVRKEEAVSVTLGMAQPSQREEAVSLTLTQAKEWVSPEIKDFDQTNVVRSIELPRPIDNLEFTQITTKYEDTNESTQSPIESQWPTTARQVPNQTPIASLENQTKASNLVSTVQTSPNSNPWNPFLDEDIVVQPDFFSQRQDVKSLSQAFLWRAEITADRLSTASDKRQGLSDAASTAFTPSSPMIERFGTLSQRPQNSMSHAKNQQSSVLNPLPDINQQATLRNRLNRNPFE
jgi:hypothetical protein